MNARDRSRPPPDRLAGGRCADPRARAAARPGPRADRSHASPFGLADPRKVVPRVHDHHARRRRLAVPLADRRLPSRCSSSPSPSAACVVVGSRAKPLPAPFGPAAERPRSRTRSTATSWSARFADRHASAPSSAARHSIPGARSRPTAPGSSSCAARWPAQTRSSGSPMRTVRHQRRLAATPHDRLGGMVAAGRRHRGLA